MRYANGSICHSQSDRRRRVLRSHYLIDHGLLLLDTRPREVIERIDTLAQLLNIRTVISVSTASRNAVQRVRADANSALRSEHIAVRREQLLFGGRAISGVSTQFSFPLLNEISVARHKPENRLTLFQHISCKLMPSVRAALNRRTYTHLRI